MMEVEAFQKLILEVEAKELEAMKKRVYEAFQSKEQDPPSTVELYPVINYSVEKIVTPSYFQVRRTFQDSVFLHKIDENDLLRCANSDSFDKIKYEVASMLSTNPDFNIRDTVMETAERIGDSELYKRTIEGLATMILCLYPPETLLKGYHARSHHTQSNQLWDHIQQPKTPSIPDFCNAIMHRDIDYNQYPLITQADTDEFIAHYFTEYFDHESKTRCLRAPLANLPLPQRKKSEMFKEMRGIVDGMRPRMRVDLDNYTRSLITLAGPNSWDKEQELLDHIITVINPSCEKWKSDMMIYILCRIECEEFRIKKLSTIVRQSLYHLVYYSDPPFLVCKDVWKIIEIAAFRCEALGSRFIKRNHLLWAFYELGFGLPPKMTLKLNFEDEDRPPYDLYLASIKFAKSLGNEIVQLQHFIFTVLFLKDFADDTILATKMKELFTAFLRDVAFDSLKRPNENAHSWLKKLHALV